MRIASLAIHAAMFQQVTLRAEEVAD